ncbi:MAG TPA: endonuclease/exonuclease/phosphatase family protein [Actinomycetota bacterium]|nr:endonuclease/exonuclease/phosphatase family protein [Actinomycetota bacterium]
MGEFTVATYNLRHCEGLDGIVDVDRAARAMTGAGAEALGFQEIDDGLTRSGKANQAAELGERLGFDVAFHPTLERGGGRYGLGFAARGEVETHFERLPRRGDEEARGAIVAKANGVWFVVTHLSTDRISRATQTRALASIASQLDGPVLVMGDLNQSGGSLGPLAEAGLVSDGLRHGTLQHSLPGWLRRPLGLVGLPRPKHIDHVLAGGGARVVRSWTVASEASDHLPLVAEIMVP